MRSSFAELAGATTAIVLPGASASGLRGFVMREGGKKEVYNAPAKSKLIQKMFGCSRRNDASSCLIIRDVTGLPTTKRGHVAAPTARRIPARGNAPGIVRKH